MKKKPATALWAWGLVLIVMGSIIGMAIASSSAPAPGPVEDAELTISEPSWDFGDIPMSEGIAVKSIALANNSSVPIAVTSLETSCMCTTAQIVHPDGSKSGLKGMIGHGGGSSSLSETIPAGETATLLVNFDPNAHGPAATGPITRTVMMMTNSQTQPQINLTFSGNVIK